MFDKDNVITRRNFLWGLTALCTLSTFTSGCNNNSGRIDHSPQDERAANTDPSSWWRKEGYFVQETLDMSRISKGVIRAYVDGSWQEFKVVNLPERFVTWSLDARLARLERMLMAGGMDPRDLAGSHNACVATYGGPSRDSAMSLNTAYKGMGFAVKEGKLAETIQSIREERHRIERDTRGEPLQGMHAKVKFLAEFYQESSRFDPSKQVSLELFTSRRFQTHTFSNMMANPIASASFLAFPTFEIRTAPQLLHPKNPDLSGYEKNLIAYTNTIHDFIHSGLGDRITCVYHIIELFDDTPNDRARGKRIV